MLRVPKKNRLHFIHLGISDHAFELMINKYFAFSQRSIRSRKVMERHTKISQKDIASTVSIIMPHQRYVLKSRHTKHTKTVSVLYTKFYAKIFLFV